MSAFITAPGHSALVPGEHGKYAAIPGQERRERGRQQTVLDWSGNEFLASDGRNRLLASTNGVDWVGDQWIVTRGGGEILTSPDGFVWTTQRVENRQRIIHVSPGISLRHQILPRRLIVQQGLHRPPE